MQQDQDLSIPHPLQYQSWRAKILCLLQEIFSNAQKGQVQRRIFSGQDDQNDGGADVTRQDEMKNERELCRQELAMQQQILKVATADDEYVHDEYDGSKNLLYNGKKRCNNHDDMEDDDYFK